MASTALLDMLGRRPARPSPSAGSSGASGQPAGALLNNDRNPARAVHDAAVAARLPVLYYGDETGMGDDIWLGYLDAVCTPIAVDLVPPDTERDP